VVDPPRVETIRPPQNSRLLSAESLERDRHTPSVSLDTRTRQLLGSYDTLSFSQCIEAIGPLSEQTRDEDMRSLALTSLFDRIQFLLEHDTPSTGDREVLALFLKLIQVPHCTSIQESLERRLLNRIDSATLFGSRECVRRLRHRTYLKDITLMKFSTWTPPEGFSDRQAAHVLSFVFSLDIQCTSSVEYLLRQLSVPEAQKSGMRFLWNLVREPDRADLWRMNMMTDFIKSCVANYTLTSITESRLLAVAMSRTGGVGVHPSESVYEILFRAFHSERISSLESHLQILEICNAFKLPSRLVSKRTAGRAMCSARAGRHVITLLESLKNENHLFVKSSTSRVIPDVVVALAECISQPQAPLQPAAVWQDLVGYMVDNANPVPVHLLLRFILASERSNCPLTVKGDIRRCLSPLAIMAVRSAESVPDAVIDVIAHVDTADPMVTRMTEEIVQRVLGRLRSGENVPIKHALFAGQFAGKSPPELVKYVQDRLNDDEWSEADAIRLLRVSITRCGEWESFANVILERIPIMGGIAETILIGRVRQTPEWAAHAESLLRPPFEVSSGDLMDRLVQQSEVELEQSRFPDGRPSALTARAFCGFVASLSLLSSGLGVAELILRNG
jgi:hypothetical protein